MSKDLDMSDVIADGDRMHELLREQGVDVHALRIRRLEAEAAREPAAKVIGHYLVGNISLMELTSELANLLDTICYCPLCDSAKKVTGHGVTPGPDPTAFAHLECGHTVL